MRTILAILIAIAVAIAVGRADAAAQQDEDLNVMEDRLTSLMVWSVSIAPAEARRQAVDALYKWCDMVPPHEARETRDDVASVLGRLGAAQITDGKVVEISESFWSFGLLSERRRQTAKSLGLELVSAPLLRRALWTLEEATESPDKLRWLAKLYEHQDQRAKVYAKAIRALRRWYYDNSLPRHIKHDPQPRFYVDADVERAARLYTLLADPDWYTLFGGGSKPQNLPEAFVVIWAGRHKVEAELKALSTHWTSEERYTVYIISDFILACAEAAP